VVDDLFLVLPSIFAACNYNHTRDCPGQNCVTGAIEDLFLLQDTNMMQGRSIPKGDSLKFMIHFLQGTCYLMYGVRKLLMDAVDERILVVTQTSISLCMELLLPTLVVIVFPTYDSMGGLGTCTPYGIVA
jgi:hypothetical protein